MSSKTPSVAKTSAIAKTPITTKTSAIAKTPVIASSKTSASERASSFVTPRSSRPHASSSSSSSNEGRNSPTYYKERAAQLGVDCPELTFIDDLHVYGIGESMIDCNLQVADIVGPIMERSGVMYVTCYANTGEIVKVKAFAPVSAELEKIVNNYKVASFHSLHATEPYIKDKHNSPLSYELLFKNDSSAKGYMSNLAPLTKTIDNFEELNDGIVASVRVAIMQDFRLSTIDKGQRFYVARVFDRHLNRAEFTMNLNNDENAAKFRKGRVFTVKGVVSVKGIIKIKARVEDIHDVENNIEFVPQVSQTHTPKKLKLSHYIPTRFSAPPSTTSSTSPIHLFYNTPVFFLNKQ